MEYVRAIEAGKQEPDGPDGVDPISGPESEPDVWDQISEKELLEISHAVRDAFVIRSHNGRRKELA